MKTHTNRQIQVMRIALGLSGLPCNDAAAETVLLVNREMKRLGSKFSIRESSEIEYFITRKYKMDKIISTEKVKPTK
jgi:hypothetical protein